MPARPPALAGALSTFSSWMRAASRRPGRARPDDPERLVDFSKKPPYRPEKDGSVQRSRDSGETWERAGRAPGEPYKFKATGQERLFSRSVTARSPRRQGERTWREVCEP